MADLSKLAIAERNAKRQARRLKQREANIGRAQKMHSARIAHSDPRPDNLPTAPQLRFQVGCSGWFYWHWRETFYPLELPTHEWFDYYARRFTTVELNAPFYSWPTIATVKSWLRQAGRRNFVYTVKVCELITHVKRFSRTKELIKDFGYIAELLGSRMGCFLFQLPPSFHYTPARLKNILGQLDPRWRNVVEFRHRSWWNERVFAAFRKSSTIFCSCSAPKLPDELVKTADDLYIRFHGSSRWYRHDYSTTELMEWTKRIRMSGAARVWIYFNNDRDGYAVKNARRLLRYLNS